MGPEEAGLATALRTLVAAAVQPKDEESKQLVRSANAVLRQLGKGTPSEAAGTATPLTDKLKGQDTMDSLKKQLADQELRVAQLSQAGHVLQEQLVNAQGVAQAKFGQLLAQSQQPSEQGQAAKIQLVALEEVAMAAGLGCPRLS